MEIQVNTDHNTEGHERLVSHVEDTVFSALSHLSPHVTRVEVHISDENGDKTGHHDKRCMMEARIKGRRPNAVTCEAETLEQAVVGATEKLKSSLTSTLERIHDHH